MAVYSTGIARVAIRSASVSKTLGRKIGAGKLPSKECAELATYLERIESLAKAIVDDVTAENLTRRFHHLQLIPSVYRHVDHEKMIEDGVKTIQGGTEYRQMREKLQAC